ncbi:MAG: hypothetical protein WAL21_08630, partial [Nitrososphaeraceae archaeon]
NNRKNSGLHSTKSIIFYIITNFLVTMVVVVKCKKCRQEFPSTLVNVSDERTLKSSSFTDNNETCLVAVTIRTIINRFYNDSEISLNRICIFLS